MGYSLVVIEDEAVALSGAIPTYLTSKSPLFIGTMLMVIMISLVIIATAYSIRLHYYQARLDVLTAQSDVFVGDYNSRSVRSIRGQIDVIEEIIAEGSLGGFVPMM